MVTRGGRGGNDRENKMLQGSHSIFPAILHIYPRPIPSGPQSTSHIQIHRQWRVSAKWNLLSGLKRDEHSVPLAGVTHQQGVPLTPLPTSSRFGVHARTISLHPHGLRGECVRHTDTVVECITFLVSLPSCIRSSQTPRTDPHHTATNPMLTALPRSSDIG